MNEQNRRVFLISILTPCVTLFFIINSWYSQELFAAFYFTEESQKSNNDAQQLFALKKNEIPPQDHGGISEEADLENFVSFFSSEYQTKVEMCNFRLNRTYNITAIDTSVLSIAKTEYEKAVARADCGDGYILPSSNNQAPTWKVYFIGDGWYQKSYRFRFYSGCPKSCPLSPNCQIHFDDHADIAKNPASGNVIVAHSFDWRESLRPVLASIEGNPNRYHVIYWREANWLPKPVMRFQRHSSFEMGCHYSAMVLNPAVQLPPSDLLKGMFLNSEQKYFAASIISDCHANSLRDEYIEKIVQQLEILKRNIQIHRYGKCGGMSLPGRNLNSQLKRLSQYKFIFAFENTIQSGYVTEKLFTSLLLPSVPVFYGSNEGIPNITTSPSFIRASDFPSPEHLVKYLLYLDGNDQEYRNYQNWRKHPEPFTNEYLHTMAFRVPGYLETILHNGNQRTASCCRLCNPDYVKWATENRKVAFLHTPSEAEIYRRYFSKPLAS